MKIFIGTLKSSENDFDRCTAAIHSQRHVDFEHFIVAGLPEKEAHQELYSKWNSAKSEFDLFLKVDADTVLHSPDVVASFVQLFEQTPRLTGVQAWLHDYMTDQNIFGLTCLRNTVTVNSSVDKLYCDRVDSGHDIVLRGDKLPSVLCPAGLHCHFASELQAFHYGVHRAKKNQEQIRQQVYRAWKNHSCDRVRGFALLGFMMAPQCADFDYNSPAFVSLYSEACRQYDDATKLLDFQNRD